MLYFYNQGRDHRDIGFAFGIGMMVLTFPVGFAVYMLWTVVVSALENTIQFEFGGIVVLWAALVAAGHWQWFVLVPRLLARIERRLASRKAPREPTR